jgi:quinol monooxygenase YgiN
MFCDAVILRAIICSARRSSGCVRRGISPPDSPTSCYLDQAAVEAHRATDYFKALGRKMGEYMDGRADVAGLTQI